ncbi:MAG TPA: hypothetical protein PLB25_09855 [Rhodoferax sp.]|nr:hypothetical protein [Rhodoferax sp.]
MRLWSLFDVVEKCLNQAEGERVKRIFRRAQYERPMGDAWRLCSDRPSLLPLSAASEATNVVQGPHRSSRQIPSSQSVLTAQKSGIA